MVPLARSQALCIGIMSYDGQVNFGLIGDYDGMPDLDSSADLEAASSPSLSPRRRGGKAEAQPERRRRRPPPTAPAPVASESR